MPRKAKSWTKGDAAAFYSGFDSLCPVSTELVNDGRLAQTFGEALVHWPRFSKFVSRTYRDGTKAAA